MIVITAARAALVLVAVLGLAAPALAMPRAERPEDVGLSSERLSRLTERMRLGVERGELPGAVVLVGRRGRIAYLESFGLRDPETRAPMRADAIFRIASMSKPFTSLAIMMLAEEGRLSIADPVAKYLPALRDLKVAVVRRDADGRPETVLEAPRRPMTVHDLLRHTSGLTYGLAGPHPVKQAYVDARVGSSDDTNEQLVAKLAKLPLVFQPGSTWEYSVSTDVLGRIVEVVSGQPLDRFIGRGFERDELALAATRARHLIEQPAIDAVADAEAEDPCGAGVRAHRRDDAAVIADVAIGQADAQAHR